MDHQYRQNCSILHGLWDISIFVFCDFFAKKFENSKWATRQKFFLKIGIATLQGYPVGQTFHRNCSIAHSFWDRSIFVFCNFCEIFENSKWLPILARHKFLENQNGYAAEIPYGSKILLKLLNLTRFLRYKHFCVLQFCQKFENSNWPPFLASETKIFWKLEWLLCRDILWVKNFVEIALFRTVF